jgi:xanthine dehydrogenase accessory factor
VLTHGEPCIVNVDLTENPEDGGEKICGGRMDVFVDLWTAHDMTAANALLTRLETGHGVMICTVIKGPAEMRGRRWLAADDGWCLGTLNDRALDAALAASAASLLQIRRSQVICLDRDGVRAAGRHEPDDATEVFVEVLERPPALVIAGAGHCALPLARLGKMLGFEVVILDDRPDCATQERFPDAARIVVGDLGAEVEALKLGPEAHVVLVTRGHKQDEAILRRVIDRDLAYIGMIGSRRRIGAVFADMERDGYDPALLDRVHSPIGLDIGAETPEEIAVSIMGEIIKTRRGGTGSSLTLRSPSS